DRRSRLSREDSTDLPVAEHLTKRTVAEPLAVRSKRQLQQEALDQAVETILIGARPAPFDVSRCSDAAIAVSVDVAPAAAQRVRRRDQDAVVEAAIQLRLQRV